LAPLAFLSPRIVYAITNGTIPGCAKTRLETASRRSSEPPILIGDAGTGAQAS
jgi:hypothetical protein